MNNQRRYLRVVVLGASAFIILFVANAAYSTIKHRGLTKLVVHTSIPGSQVKLDGNLVRGSDQYVGPGRHALEAAKTGFDTHKTTVFVSSGVTADVYLPLNPSSSAAEAYLANNPKVAAENSQLFQIKEDVTQKKVQQQYPFLKSLPLESPYYTVGYTSSQKFPEDSSKIAITIRAPSAYGRNWAISELSRVGVDTTKQEIIFIDYNNPFSAEGAPR